jgi:diguanylate cyclase (GGDEF)-like protein/PAS domain S-box-containing protein
MSRRPVETGVSGQVLAGLALLLLALVWLAPGASAAVNAIAIDPDTDRMEVTGLGLLLEGRGDSIQIETAAAADGVSGRMAVRAQTPGTNPNWMVFALTNATPRPIERWLTAERYSAIGSGVIWPDLDARRMEAVTPSLGFVPERVKSDRADIFRIALEPGQTITYAVELSSERFARFFIWKPVEYELKARDRQLFNGVLLGISGLLALFLTAIFAANHKAIFPATALVAWCVLAYLCVDFGFWHKLLQLRADDNAVWRAATESAIAASLVIFLGIFLRLGHWNGFVRMLMTVWIIAQLAVVALAVIDPRLASTFARASFAGIGGIGALLTLFLALSGQDRALSLVPTWILFLVWIFAAGVMLTGRLAGDAVVSGVSGGLVLVVALLGFTVTQFAFRSVEPVFAGAPGELALGALALDLSGSGTWEWNARREEIKAGAMLEATLGLRSGELACKVEGFIRHIHPDDRERFRLQLWSVQERGGGPMRLEFRMRHADNTYRWIELDAASVPGEDRRALRCLGLVRDVTEARLARDRLLADAVHDSLTGLPNRELFLDRLTVAVARAKSEPAIRPTVLVIGLDKFKSVNSSYGLVVGDSVLLTIARRLQRHLSGQDTLGRIGGDQFAMLLPTAPEPKDLAALAERIRRSLRAPTKMAGQEIVLTGSLGIAVYDGAESHPLDLLKEAEVAMHRAKRGGSDRIEIFQPELRAEVDDRVAVESDLRRALERRQLRVLYQPIVYLPTEELAGFEALVRWEHPKHGLLNPADFVPVAEESDLIVKLGSYVLTQAVADAQRWQRALPREDEPLFVSVNVSSRQLFRQDLIQEIRHVLSRATIPAGTLRLEVTESLVMENPEQATEILGHLKAAGARLSLDDFGTGYSSLAYLQRFPFDTIKIDRALVHASAGHDSGGPIVRSIVALAQELGRKVVAEGVESGEDVAFLRATGCQYAQGFYYGEPMSEKELMQLLKVVRKSERKLSRRGLFRNTTRPRRERAEAPEPAVTPASAAPSGQARSEANGAQTPPRPAPAPQIGSRAAGPTTRLRPRIQTPARVNGAGAPERAAIAPAAARNGQTSPPVQPAAPADQVPRTQPPTLPPTARPTLPPGAAPPVAARPAAGAPPPLPPATLFPEAAAGVPPLAAPAHGGAGLPPIPTVPLPPRPAAAPSMPNLARLPPGIAASLARLAGSFPGNESTAPPPSPKPPAKGDGPAR